MSRWFITVVLVAAMAPSELAGQTDNYRAVNRTINPLAQESILPGAIYELRLRVPWLEVPAYLDHYAEWHMPVDLAEGSGRRLISVLLRELGDDYNLVFLYWYESPFKQDYYCKTTRAFFSIHSNSADTSAEFVAAFDKARLNLGLADDPDSTLERVIEKLTTCEEDGMPSLAVAVEQAIGMELFEKVESDAGTWNYGVNPCKVRVLNLAKQNQERVSETSLEGCDKSVLEAATAE